MTGFGTRGPAIPIRAKGIRPGMRVRCPWCERSEVAVTKNRTLIKHVEGDLDRPGTPTCEGTGQRIDYGLNGQIVKAE